jgi:hypothetical protein
VRLVTPDREKAWSHLLTVSSLRQGCEVKPARFLNQWEHHPIPPRL